MSIFEKRRQDDDELRELLRQRLIVDHVSPKRAGALAGALLDPDSRPEAMEQLEDRIEHLADLLEKLTTRVEGAAESLEHAARRRSEAHAVEPAMSAPAMPAPAGSDETSAVRHPIRAAEHEVEHLRKVACRARFGPRRRAQAQPLPAAASVPPVRCDRPELMFDGFASSRFSVKGTSINALYGGAGPPLLLLHGYPQTHAMWHRVAPRLAERFTVVCPDLRGYGDSAKPASDETHEPYSKRAMAQDQVEVMQHLGYERFGVVGHDRGARVARRLALDHPQAVSKLALLDIVPTTTIYASLDKDRATAVWRYFFLIQPPPLPERLIGADPRYYLRWTLNEWAGTTNGLDSAALSEYERCFDEATIHASCEDYRAGATIYLDHDGADVEQVLSCPLLLLWSEHGIGSSYDVLEIWSKHANDIRGRALDCGHFLAEERPREVVSELLDFLVAG